MKWVTVRDSWCKIPLVNQIIIRIIARNPPPHLSFERRKDQPFLQLWSCNHLQVWSAQRRSAKWFKLHPLVVQSGSNYILSPVLSITSKCPPTLEVELDAFPSQLTILTAAASGVRWLEAHIDSRRYVTFLRLNIYSPATRVFEVFSLKSISPFDMLHTSISQLP